MIQTAAEFAATVGVYKSTSSKDGRPVFAIRCPLVASQSGNSVHLWAHISHINPAGRAVLSNRTT